MKQKSLNHGTLIKWNKGFTNAGAVNEDPTDLLEAALSRNGMQVRFALLDVCAVILHPGVQHMTPPAMVFILQFACRQGLCHWSMTQSPLWQHVDIKTRTQ